MFHPNVNYITASKRLCICDQCKIEYGTCSLFEKFELTVGQLKGNTLRSTVIPTSLPDNPTSSSTAHEFLLQNSICAVAADEKSTETVHFIYVEEVVEMEEDEEENNDSGKVGEDDDSEDDKDCDHESSDEDDDDEMNKDIYGHVIPSGCSYVRGKYLEKHSETKKGLKYRKMKVDTYFYKESVVYPFVNHTMQNKNTIIHISKNDYCEVLAYVEASGMACI